MRGAIPPLSNTTSWRGAQSEAQGQLLFTLVIKFFTSEEKLSYVVVAIRHSGLFRYRIKF
jgi:hypothetical protein